MAGWFRAGRGDVRLTVRLTPKGGVDRIDGLLTLADGREVLSARVKAAPEKGAANAALVRLIAGALGVPPAKVSVSSGHRARLKGIHVNAGVAELGARLTSLAEQQNGRNSR